MKKMLSLTLALILCLTGVSALAADSPKLPTAWTIDFSKTVSLTPGVTVEQISKESTDLVNEVVKNGGLDDKVVFLNDNGEPAENPIAGKTLTNACIAPMPSINVGEFLKTISASDSLSVGGALAILETPIPQIVAEFLTANDALEFFCFKDGDTTYGYQLTYRVSDRGHGQFTLLNFMPISILNAAAGHPSFMDIEVVNK